MNVERIVLEFSGGPFDGGAMGWHAGDAVPFPEDLYGPTGSYHLQLRGEEYAAGLHRVTSRFVYTWTEGGEPL